MMFFLGIIFFIYGAVITAFTPLGLILMIWGLVMMSVGLVGATVRLVGAVVERLERWMIGA